MNALKYVSLGALYIKSSAFYCCGNLEAIDLPDAITFEEQIFQGCSKLSNVNVPSLKTIGYQAFMETGITEINLPELTKMYPLYTSNSNIFNGCTKLHTIRIPSLTVLEAYSCYGCSALTTIEAPNVMSILQISIFLH
jgi:hypothetical protein